MHTNLKQYNRSWIYKAKDDDNTTKFFGFSLTASFDFESTPTYIIAYLQAEDEPAAVVDAPSPECSVVVCSA